MKGFVSCKLQEFRIGKKRVVPMELKSQGMCRLPPLAPILLHGPSLVVGETLRLGGFS